MFRCCFLLLAFVLSAVSFCLCRLFCALVVASPHLFSLVWRLGLARGWKVFSGLRGGGCAHALAREGQRQQSFRGRHSSTEDGASLLKKEKALTAQRAAQVGSRRKRIADFRGKQQRFRGRHSTEDGASWLKKEKCKFRGRHSKEVKDSKVLFFGF